MTGSCRAILRRVFFAALASLAFAFVLPGYSLAQSVEVGQSIPEFSLPDLEGRPISFDNDIRGKAPLALLFFMTTACSACYEELQELNDFVKRNPGKIDLWCVAVDLRGANLSEVTNLTAAQLSKAVVDTDTRLPSVLAG